MNVTTVLTLLAALACLAAAVHRFDMRDWTMGLMYVGFALIVVGSVVKVFGVVGTVLVVASLGTWAVTAVRARCG